MFGSEWEQKKAALLEKDSPVCLRELVYMRNLVEEDPFRRDI